MATRKSKQVPADAQEGFLSKIGDQAVHLKDELLAGKNHLVEFATGKIDAVKTAISDYRERKKSPSKKGKSKTLKKAAAKIKPKVNKVKKAAVKKVAGVKKKAAKKSAVPRKAAAKNSTGKKSRVAVKKPAGKK